MFKRTVSLLLVLVLLAVPATAAVTGDPLDSNDQIIGNDSFAEGGCANAYQYPNCVPCWTQCIFAMMADAAHDGAMDWNW